ncbi:MucR family transcriptional regulator [Skermanella aerolata]|uniref:MucR family transcriptional regulator n=1 Tax=Skermanella aerolata TaxID=393310 RepID=A0A512E4G9_9PROT|nr:MucR family transcriptional regulator [Skermanella aerolata]KJB90202.1 hypothetical protein N826_04690 [Skermanella aerolata KACC 11604]GEO43636.1 MucR family transcriptional regulator [Skermanella aerolata]
MTLDHKSEASPGDLVALSAVIMAGYLRGNALPVDAIAEVIELVHDSLQRLDQPADPLKPEVRKPAVPVRKSVTDAYIVCLEDGKKLKMLRRHLRTTCGMTPEEYREKWNLPDNYPMVAPAYARQRSALARELGLGRKRFKPDPEAVPVRRAGRRPKI